MGMKFSLMHSWCAGSIRIFYKVGVGTATHAVEGGKKKRRIYYTIAVTSTLNIKIKISLIYYVLYIVRKAFFF